MQERKSLEVELRRNLDRLYILGNGVILFSVWGLFKGMILRYIPEVTVENLSRAAGDILPKGTVFLLVGSSILLDFFLRLIIGYCARSDGQGKMQNPFYIVFAVFLTLSYLYTIIVRIIMYIRNPGDFVDGILMLLIDITSFLILVDLVYSAVKLRRVACLLKEQ